MAKRKIKKKEVVKEEGVNKKLVKVENKQLMWVIVAIVLVFFSFFVTYYYAQSLKKFEYAGMPFEKVKEYDLNFHGRFPIPTLYYGGEQKYYNFWLVDDPRKNNISMDFVLVNKKIIISIETDAGNCQSAGRAHVELSKFLGSISPNMELVGAFADKDIAEAVNMTYATCADANNSQTVLVYHKSESPSIKQSSENENCYYINVGECENLKTIERFIVGIIAQINKVEL